MSEFHFGTGPGRLPKRANTIAKRHGAYVVNAHLPGERPRHWFCCPNRGFPFDDATARAVMADLRAAGILKAEGGDRGNV